MNFKEYVDDGIAGRKDKRPALNLLMNDARKRRFDAVLVWRFVHSAAKKALIQKRIHPM